MRTKYFSKAVTNETSLKRLKDGKVEYFTLMEGTHPANTWQRSCYTAEELTDKLSGFTQLTRDDARKAYPKAFRATKKEPVTVVVAVPGVPVNTKPGLEMAKKLRDAVGTLDYNGREKIAAIKAIRMVEGFGLAESKAIVENFEAFLSFVEEHNEYPEIDYRGWNEPAVFTKRTANRTSDLFVNA